MLTNTKTSFAQQIFLVLKNKPDNNIGTPGCSHSERGRRVQVGNNSLPSLPHFLCCGRHEVQDAELLCNLS